MTFSLVSIARNSGGALVLLHSRCSTCTRRSGAHPAIGDVAVLVIGTGLDARLHAVVTRVGVGPMPSLLAMKRWCADRLPTYMVVDALPLTANGKTDRARLTATIEAPA